MNDETSKKRFVSVDPGKHVAWAAFWFDEIFCGLQTYEAPFADFPRDWPTLIEVPRIYPTDRDKRPNDIVDLAFAAGQIVGKACAFAYTYPQGWKGQHSKDVTMARVKRALSPAETEAFESELARLGIPKGKQHNAFDAVGIGLSHLLRY